jgi:adenosylcobinamide kinase/adenosylcobinamide-phosphate guanylyltransferase
MEVVLLGTAAAGGWPTPFCTCTSCSVLRARGEVRAQTSALIDDAILLDCGPDTVNAATRAGRSLAGVHTVLLTHEDADHCDPAFLLWRSWARASIPLLVTGPAAALDRCRDWIGPVDSGVELREVRAGDHLSVGTHDVRVLAADHKPGSVLYEVSGADGARVLYATDTGPLPERTVAACAARHADLVLLEQTWGDTPAAVPGHLGLREFGEAIAELRGVGGIDAAGSVVAVHLSHRNLPEPGLSRRLAEHGARAYPDLTVLDVQRGAGATARGDAPPRRVLVTGGARSGKSLAAESLVAPDARVTYVATAPAAPDDPEWTARVSEHRIRRPERWKTQELADPRALADLLRGAAREDTLLVDCMTLWLTSLADVHGAWDSHEARVAVAIDVDEVVDAWRTSAARVVAVTNEIGSGVVPATSSGRYLRDELGRLNARLADLANEVHLCVAGRTVRLP